jgi:hypothetical protein
LITISKPITLSDRQHLNAGFKYYFGSLTSESDLFENPPHVLLYLLVNLKNMILFRNIKFSNSKKWINVSQKTKKTE